MLILFVIAAFAIYWLIALYFVRRSQNERVSRRWAWLICVCIFTGDHVIGYLWFSYYSSYVSVNTPVKIITEDWAIETNENRDAENSGFIGSLAIFRSIYWLVTENKQFPKFFVAEQYIGHSVPLSGGSGNLEIIDKSHKIKFPNEAPKVVKYSLVKIPDDRCNDFEAYRNKWLKSEFKKLSQDNIGNYTKKYAIDLQKYCIAREETNQVTAPYTSISSEIREGGFWDWGLPALFGVYSYNKKYIDNKTKKIVYEYKNVNFVGGWVWQFITYFPDTNFNIASAVIKTPFLPND